MDQKNSRALLLVGSDGVEFGVSEFEGVWDVSEGRRIAVPTREHLREVFAETSIRSTKNELPLLTRGICDGPRKKENIRAPFLVFLDVDDSPVSLAECSTRLDGIGVSHIGFTTYSHDPEGTGLDRYRIVTDLLASDWESLRAITIDLARAIDLKVDATSAHGIAFFAPGSDGTRQVERVIRLDGPSSWQPDPSVWEKSANRPASDQPLVVPTNVDMDEIRDALRHVTDDDGSRDRWLQIGMGLHSTGHPDAHEVWDEWSQRQDSGKYDPDDQERTWESFSARGNGEPRVTVGTIYHLAREGGWRRLNRGGAREDFAGVEDDISSDREAFLLQINERYAYVSLGQGKVVDLGAKDGSIRFLSTKAFTEMMNYPRWPAGLNGRGIEKAGSAWLHNWEQRPTYDRIDFIPPDAKTEVPTSTLNLWRHWKYEDAPVGGSCDLFLDHVREVICGGDEHVFEWVLAWLGHLVQNPGEKPGTAIVLRGIEGTGKGIFANTVRELCGPHGIQVTHPRQLTGNFNHHLADKLLVFADEVTWGGYKKDDGVLKTMITEPTMVLEAKGIDSIEVRSFCRVIISSNNDWVVPTGRSSRRFLVLDVTDSRVGDSAYFGSIVDQLRGGGYAALWRHLRYLDLTQLPDPTKVIRTAALRDQKIESLDDRGKWVLDFLQQGELYLGTFDDSSWPTFASSSDLHDNYQRFAHNHRTPRICTSQQVSGFLKEVFGNDCLGRRTIDGRQIRGITLPPLDEARRRFEAWIQSSIEWED